MAGWRSIGRSTAALVLVLALGACATRERIHGYIPSESEIAALVPGSDTRASIATNLGRPGLSGVMASSDWFYVRSRWQTRGPAAPVEVSREALALSFDAAGVLTEVRRFDLSNGRAVPISRRVTASGIRQMGLLGQILRNIGNIAPGQFIDSGPPRP
jgi:outer membrane protein assembly factor BamE (lipoprotein component of BamABCDE complex)